ncbi:hypothetical protein F5Y06DRAFT_307540 [Hypoxylon sp. FL0890]|nr:hypothetical protein F5Y06DRAFT_307540 [Hypoxylon sp. FL0890]
MAPPNKRQKTMPQPSDKSDFVTITIPSGKEFSAHAHLLAHHSKYFLRALNSPFREATTRHFELSEWATEATVSTFVMWIYGSPESITFAERLTYQDVIECWLLGDYILATEFRNSVIRAMFERKVDTDAIIASSKRISSECRLVPFFVRLLCRDVNIYDIKVLENLLEELPRTLLLQVTKRAISQTIRLIGRAANHGDNFRFSVEEHLEEL